MIGIKPMQSETEMGDKKLLFFIGEAFYNTHHYYFNLTRVLFTKLQNWNLHS